MRLLRRQLLFLFPLIVLVLSFAPLHEVKADHYVGSELTYAYAGTPGLYLLRLKFYRDCGGIPMWDEIVVNGQAPGCTPFSVNFILIQNNFALEISEVCPGQATECSLEPDPSIQGVELYEYTGIINLAANGYSCDNWTFFLESGNRNGGIINLNNSNSMYLGFYTAAFCNNVSGINNSSPVFASSPVPFVCLNDTVLYNLQATDPDADSLVYSLAPALENATSTISYSTNYTFLQPFGGSSINSFATNLNSETGQLTFRPLVAGPYVVVVRIEEWRVINGVPVLVGSMNRDVQVQVVNCTSPPPKLQLLGLEENGIFVESFSPTDTKVLEACTPYCISIPATTTANPLVTLLLTSNAATEVPNSTFVVTGQGTQNPVGKLCFQPSPLLDGQTFSFTVAVEDNSCPYTNALSQAIQIKVKKSTGFKVMANIDSICAGQSVQLGSAALAGKLPLTDPAYSGFSWTAVNLQGISVNGYFQGGNTASLNPVVFPVQTTRYILSASTVFGCTDTASVVIYVKGIQPEIQSLSLQHPVLCIGQTSALTPLISGPVHVPNQTVWTYNWSPGIGLNDSAAAVPILSFAGQSPVTYTLVAGNGTCYDTSQVSVTFVTDNVSVSSMANPDTVCLGQPVSLGAMASGPGSLGSSFKWMGDRLLSPLNSVTTAYPAGLSSTEYIMQVTTAQGCIVHDTVEVTIAGVQPFLNDFPISGLSICSGITGQASAVVTFDSAAINPAFSYNWSPGIGLSSSTISNPEIYFAGQNAVEYLVTVTNGSCTDTSLLNVLFVPSVSVEVAGSVSGGGNVMEMCLGDTVMLTSMLSPAGLQNPAYLWVGSGVFDATSPQTFAIPQQPGIHEYILTASAGENCLDTDTVRIRIIGVKPKIDSLFASQSPVCIGSPVSITTVIGITPPEFPEPHYMYTWASETRSNILENENQIILNVKPGKETMYFFEASDSGVCAVTDSIIIQVGTEPDYLIGISFSPDSTNPAPVTVTFTTNSAFPETVKSVVWELENHFTGKRITLNSTVLEANHLFTEGGNYTIFMTVITADGCEYTIEKGFTIRSVDTPNIITPNGDGINDAFLVPGILPGSNVQIFNRWGVRIAEFGNEPWSPGADLPAGIYFYSVQQPENAEPKKGWLEIVR